MFRRDNSTSPHVYTDSDACTLFFFLCQGVKGTGKTKQMIELINEAAKTEAGNVVCIERGSKLTYDIHNSIRLVEASEYSIGSFDALKGFISGLYAGNYDISQIFIDSLCKIVPSEISPEVEKFLDWLENFSEKHNIKFVVTISADQALAKIGRASCRERV